jgi:omega-amidase
MLRPMRIVRVGAAALELNERDVPENLARARAALQAATRRGVQVLALPEMWPTSFVPSADERLVRASEEAVLELSGDAKQLGIVVVGSGFAALPGRAPVNRAHVLGMDDAWEEPNRPPGYDKVHLFTPTAEHLAFSAGEVLPGALAVEVRRSAAGEATADLFTGRVRLAPIICYDLRFGELVRHPVRGGAELLVVVAQWPDVRTDAWRALVIGRAAESQAFVLAANRRGAASLGRRRARMEFSGHTLVAGPGGELLASGTISEELLVCDVDLEDVRRIRRLVPVLRDERPEIYARHRAVTRSRGRIDDDESE